MKDNIQTSILHSFIIGLIACFILVGIKTYIQPKHRGILLVSLIVLYVKFFVHISPGMINSNI